MGYSFSTYTLMYNGGFWQEATWLGGIPIVVGVIVASLSSGLGALFGGSRILQVGVSPASLAFVATTIVAPLPIFIQCLNTISGWLAGDVTRRSFSQAIGVHQRVWIWIPEG